MERLRGLASKKGLSCSLRKHWFLVDGSDWNKQIPEVHSDIFFCWRRLRPMLRSSFCGTETRQVSLCFAFRSRGAKDIQKEFLAAG